MEARDLRLKQVQQEQREQALKESGLHREGSAGSEEARGGKERDYSVARGSDGNLIDARTVSHAQFREQKDRMEEQEERTAEYQRL